MSARATGKRRKVSSLGPHTVFSLCPHCQFCPTREHILPVNQLNCIFFAISLVEKISRSRIYGHSQAYPDHLENFPSTHTHPPPPQNATTDTNPTGFQLCSPLPLLYLFHTRFFLHISPTILYIMSPPHFLLHISRPNTAPQPHVRMAKQRRAKAAIPRTKCLQIRDEPERPGQGHCAPGAVVEEAVSAEPEFCQ